MNANCFRLVLDKRTGTLIPVAEFTSRAGKGRGRNRGGDDGPSSAPQWGGLYTAMAFAGLLAPGLGGAQTVTVDGAGNHVTVNSSANDVPLINIADPNASGLSHNKFIEFNVGEQGLIFNNSLSDGITAIGGAAMKNPHLSRQATGILTEVTGTSITNLKGSMEVFGGTADVLIANPNGLYVNGVSMVNANSLTLTTGKPSADGGKFDVHGGHIDMGQVNTEDLNYFDVVARSIKLHGAVAGDADTLLAAGLNTYLVDGRTVTLRATGGAGAPAWAIDGTAAGSMYGAHVQLRSTESGVGVRHVGQIHAATDIVISADGDLELRHLRGHDIEVKGHDITLGGDDTLKEQSVAAVGDFTLHAAGDLGVKGNYNTGSATLDVAGTLTSRDAIFGAQRRVDGLPVATLDVTADKFDALGGSYFSDGNSRDDSLKLSRTWARSKEGKTTMSLRIAHRDSNNYINGLRLDVNSRRYTDLTLGVARVDQWWGGALFADLNLGKGTPWLGANYHELPNVDPTRAHYTKWSGNVSWSRGFGGRRFEYAARGAWQYSSHAMLGASKMVIGDEYTVRGYKQNGVAGDRGGYLSNTVTMQLGAGVSAFVGVDAGAVKENEHRAEHQFISGAALGLRARMKNASLALSSATPLGANRAQPSVLYANVSLRF